MRLLSWNINGVRTLPQYHPWNTLKTCEAILDELKADIICFQEMKSSRASLERNFALPGPYDCFVSFPASKGGYSGVAVYTNSRAVVPLKAEEGLSGKLHPKPPLTNDERISLSYLLAHEISLVPDEQGRTPSDLAELDMEGRALVLDFGLFVLINLYCPNETSDTRLPYKLNYHLMLEERVRKLISEGREVIVTGDINICAAPIDHCDGALSSKANDFWEHPARSWFQKWLAPLGPMHDVVRSCWPERRSMYTCWNTKISARESNYGTRIDYFLLTKGLLPWFKHGDIQPSVKGSDHCPVYIDLHDEITTESGAVLTLREAMKMNDVKRDPPRIATKFWNEFSGKQQLLSTFFGKKSNVPCTSSSDSQAGPDITSGETLHIASQTSSDGYTLSQVSSTSTQSESLPTKVPPIPNATDKATGSSLQPSNSLPTTPKRKKVQADSNYPAQPTKKQKKHKTGQTKLSTFFGKTADSTIPYITDSEEVRLDTENARILEDGRYVTPIKSPDVLDAQQIESDYNAAQQMSLSQELQILSSDGSKNSWSQLFAPIQPPNCTIHGEPAKQFTVNKPGPNKGKTFFICSRPVGPGYDAGKAHRLREEVDPRYRCNFFKWSSEVKKASLKEAQTSECSSQG